MKNFFLLSILMLSAGLAVLHAQTYTLTVQFSPGAVYPGGRLISVDPPGVTISEDQTFTFTAGEVVNLEAFDGIPPTGVYCPALDVFANWEGDWEGDPSSSTGSVVMDRDRTVTAVYVVLAPPCPPPNMLSLALDSQTFAVSLGEAFTVNLEFTETGSAGQFSFSFSYNPAIISFDPTAGEGGISSDTAAGSELPSVSLLEPGTLVLTGTGPAGILYDFSLHFMAQSAGSDSINLTWIDGPLYFGASQGQVTVVGGRLCGDVNNDGRVDIIDALMIGQYYILIIPPWPDYDPTYADVNCDGTVNIIDALMIAQYAVGLNPQLSCCL